VNIGLLPRLTAKQTEALWFWTESSTVNPDDMVVRRQAAARIRELAVHAAQMGVSLSLEMYEDTYLGTADSSVLFLHEIDHPSVGLNPDLGNLLRMQRPVEQWRSMLLKVLPYANYWHVKNYFRMEDPARGIVLTTPAPLEFGFMNYRVAISDAIAAGYRSAFCVEHYGGDGLGVSATNARYLRGLLARSVLHGPGQRAQGNGTAVSGAPDAEEVRA
jgi:sugar phosphate isomerase/epimerase